MSLALEINDAGLVLVHDGRIVAEEPGCAMLDGREPQTGAAAAGRMRLQPLHAETRYWQDLGLGPLPRAAAAARTAADLAYAQLVRLAAAAGSAAGPTLFAVPPWYTREQLGVLAGVAREAGLPAVGLVDAAVAAAALEPAPASAVQLELTLHRAVVSVLEHAGEMRRTRYELLAQHGWFALYQAWVEMIAGAFVRKTRFDPLHEAASEQRLWDGMPGWLATLERDEAVAIELPAAGSTLSVELARADFVAAARGLYEAVLHVLQRARPVGGPLQLRVSQRWMRMPGFAESLAGLRDSEVRPLPPGAAALGALAFEGVLRRDPEQLVLVQRLPVPRAAGSAAEADCLVTTRIAPQDRATHVVYRGRSWTLGAEPLQVGAAVPPGPRALPVAAGPGVSRVHCRIASDEGGAWLEDLSTYGTLLNGERVGGRVRLRAGDCLRLGNPGVELELVRVVTDDGAA